MSDTPTPEPAAPVLIGELVVAPLVPGDKTITPPRISTTSLDRIDAWVTETGKNVDVFLCETQADYEAAGAIVANIRKVESIYEQTFKPLKSFYNGLGDEVRADEKARLVPLDVTKRKLTNKMLAWKDAETKRQRVLQQQAEELERKRAEEMRLYEAAKLEERGNATGNQAMKEAAVQMLDRPLQIAPVSIATTVPKLTQSNVKMVQRKVVVATAAFDKLASAANAQGRLMTDAEWEDAQKIAGTDLEDLVICLAASILLKRGFTGTDSVDIKNFLEPLASDSARIAVIKTIDAMWIKKAFATFGDTFKLGGVKVVLREGVG